MTHTTLRGCATLVALVLAASAGRSDAATISDSDSGPGLQLTEITQDLTLDLFDSSLGTLNGVVLTMSGAADTTVVLMNNSSVPTSLTADSGVDISYTSSLAGLDLSAAGLSLIMTTGQQTLAAGGDTYFSPLLTASGATVVGPSPSLFAVAGGGTFTISCQSLSGIALVGGGGAISSVQTSHAGCSAKVDYDYTPRQTVPEPGAMALLGLGVLGLGMARRRANT